MNAALAQSKKDAYWFVVADESTAVVYQAAAKFSALERLCSLENDASREKMSELIADRGGRSFDSHGEGRHTLQKEKTDPKVHAAIGFAKRVAKQIRDGRRDGSCSEFALIASPKFLGILREEVKVSKAGEPFLSIAKNVTAKSADEIRSLIHSTLR